MKNTRKVPVLLAFAIVATSAALAKQGTEVDKILQVPPDAEYGEYLAGECVTCHQLNSVTPGVPLIAGLPRDYLVRAMLDYRQGVRANQVMNLMAGNLGDEEIAALASYFSELNK